MKSDPVIAIVGATGAVGERLLSILEQRKFPMGGLKCFSTARSQGRELKCGKHVARAEILNENSFQGVDFAFFDASDEVSRKWVPLAIKSGAWVIDNSAAFRMESDVPLLVPEVNGDLLKSLVAGPKKLVAGPNCSTVQLVTALKPLHDKFGLERVVVSTYQSVSGAGAAAITELKNGLTEVLKGNPHPAPSVFKHPIGLNVIPQIGSFQENGFTGEEQKMMDETRKIMGLPHLKIHASCVRVPTLFCHGETVAARFSKKLSVQEARQALMDAPGVEVIDDSSQFRYPTPLLGENRDPVYVGRLRRDMSCENPETGLSFWVVSDNLRKGAALNAVQIGESLFSLISAQSR